MTIFGQTPKLSALPVIARHFAYSAYSGVVRCQSISQIWRWNDVSIFNNSEVISISGSAAMLNSTVENVSLSVALSQMLLSMSWCRANIWI